MPNIDQQTRDSASPVWDMNQERVFIENLTNQRFNFYLVFFSLVVAASVNAKTWLQLRMVTTLGSVIGVLLFLAVLGAQLKLDSILDYLFADPTNPITIVDRRAREGWYPYISVRRVVGIGLPFVFSAALLAAAVVAWWNPQTWFDPTENAFAADRATRTQLQMLFANPSMWTALGALAAVGAAGMAAIYTWLTYRLVRSQNEPNVVMYVRHDETRPTVLQIVVQNIGRGLASDVRFAPSRPIPHRAFGVSVEQASDPQSPQMSYGPLVLGIPTLGPADSRILDWGQFGGLSMALGTAPIDVVVRYRHGKKEMPSVVAHLEVASFEGTVAHDSLVGEAVRALEKIAAAAQKVAART